MEYRYIVYLLLFFFSFFIILVALTATTGPRHLNNMRVQPLHVEQVT